MRFALPFLLATAIALPCLAAPAPADELAERMLAALGGRTAWAQAKGTLNDSQQNWDGEPPVLRVVITLDFERPRFRIDTRGEGIRLVRVIDGEKHWRLTREGKIAPVPEATREEDRRWYAAHVYRTIHRIARRDPALRLAVGKDGRLEVHEGPARLAWYLLDRQGQPYRYGTYANDVGSLFGPWDHVQGGLRHPVWVSNAEGTWRAMLKRLEVDPSLDDDSFAEPAR